VRIHHNKNTGSEYGVMKVPENVGQNNEKVICLHHPSLVEEQTKRSVVIEIFYKERERMPELTKPFFPNWTIRKKLN
jgi:hypothetical protein